MTQTDNKPLDRRSRETKPEQIEIGGRTFLRNDAIARKYGLSERTLNRGDRKGAPFLFVGHVKYRPLAEYDHYLLRSVQQHNPEPPRRRGGRRS
jgi:hypothetical protein